MKTENQKEYAYLPSHKYNITPNQFKNLIAFLCIMMGERAIELLDKSPDYILEKFERYIKDPSIIRDGDTYRWGLHPSLEYNIIDVYHRKWGLEKKFTFGTNPNINEKLKIL